MTDVYSMLDTMQTEGLSGPSIGGNETYNVDKFVDDSDDPR